jgi:DNA polymerase-4
MERYKEVSEQVFSIFHRFTPLVQPLSIDEAFLDVTGSVRLFGHPVKVAEKIKQMVRSETGLTISAGVAPNMFLAKLASDLEKPDGLTVVPRDGVQGFLDPLHVKRIWGVGRQTLKTLEKIGVKTIRDLREIPIQKLEKTFGKHGKKMHLLARGIDERHVVLSHETKSLGHEITFSENITERDQAEKELLHLATRVGRRLRRYGFRGKTVQLKVKYSDFVQITRSETRPVETDDGLTIFKTCQRLLNKTAVGKRPVRLLGVSLSHFRFSGDKGQISLFHQEVARSKTTSLNMALDTVSERFGHDMILPARLIPPASQKGET